jgi:hypothetical protein
MPHSTNIRRTASIIGATGLIALSMAGLASAQPDPGTGSAEEQHCSVSCYTGPDIATTAISAPTVDASGIEVLQLGAGLLAGFALAGAGITVAAHRSHVAHPA